jgi:signal peptidase II
MPDIPTELPLMKKKYWILVIVCSVILSLDQWTKAVVLDRLPLHRRIPVIPGFFDLTHVRNTGGAFGIFGGEKSGLGALLFLVVSVMAVGILLVLFIRARENEKTLAFAYSLILSGALGNLLDRLRLGEVVDFLEFYVSSFRWPAFNIADSAICAGIGLMALELIIKEEKRGAKPISPKPK